MNTKRCSHCHRELPELFFAGNRAEKDGLKHYCRECACESQKRARSKKRFNNPRPHHISRDLDPSPKGSSD